MHQDYEFLVTCHSIIEPKYFSSPILGWYFRLFRDYYLDYQMRMGDEVLRNEMIKARKTKYIKDDDVKAYVDIYKTLTLPVQDEAYIAKEVVTFCKHQAIRKAIFEVAPLLNSNSFEAIEAKLVDALQIGNNISNIGCQYFVEWGERLKYRAEQREICIMPTGIPELDVRLNGGLRARQLGIWQAPTSRGKCLEIGTPVLMYDGSTKTVEKIRVGDRVMGPDSKPRKVLGTTRGHGPLFKIKPLKGSSWVCNKNHVLTLVRTDTDEVIDIEVKDYQKRSKWFKHIHKQFMTGVNFPPLKEKLPIDPYFMGVWFGDGTRKIDGVAVTNLRKAVGPTFDIPHEYLVASRKERREFLAGFLDTDGHLNENRFDIVQKRKDYADAICFVARSLGIHATMSPKEVYDYGVYWRVTLTVDIYQLPLRIKRKIPIKGKTRTDSRRTGFKVIPIGKGDYAGFELDGDGRFLLGNFVVTHNSTALIQCGKRAIIQGSTVFHYSLELAAMDIAERYDACFSDIKMNELSDNEGKVAFVMQDLLLRFGNRLVIKSYDTKTATVGTIKAHINQCSQFGLCPDLILVDYLDLLKPTLSRKEKRHELTEITEELRSLAIRLNVPMWTATQSRRSAIQKKEHDESDVAEDIGKINISDVTLTLNQTNDEVQAGVMRIGIAKNRNGPKGGHVEIMTDMSKMCFYVPPHADRTEKGDKKEEDDKTAAAAPPPKKSVGKKPKA